ncbi:MAG: GGDEF domain-containing protein [Burkholderiales bacterium]|nr:GGDEF domain-containing protein [Burkholderiales bacterium]
MASPSGLRVLILLMHWLVCAMAWGASTDSNVERHPLEIRALKDPQAVRAELPPLIGAARQRADYRELALLHLAEANACRVMANLACQAEAGQRAHQAAEQAGQVALQVRGLIMESRGRLAQQDFSRTSQLLNAAERILIREPDPEALADVYLAYSSLSYSVGKHANAADYARRGLKALGDRPSLIIRIRLMRNLARALAQTKDTAGARATLREAIAQVEGLDDPKLVAELYLESARIARSDRDVETQESDGRKILEFAKQLENTQLTGLGHEVLGLAALDRKNSTDAHRELKRAQQHFENLKLQRDERRVLRSLVRSMLDERTGRQELEPLMTRLISLESKLESEDRTFAADDFEARLNFFKHEMDVKRLEQVAAIDKERVASLAAQRLLAIWVAALVALLLLVLAVLFYMQRRYIAARAKAEKALAASEARLRAVTDNIPALIAHVDAAQRYTFANRFMGRVFGIDPASMLGKTMREVRGEEVYAYIQPHVERVLQGEPVQFEGKGLVGDREYQYQSSFVPDIGPDGKVAGFFSFTFDITELKRAQSELGRLIRIDSMTGAANRRHFDERLGSAIASARRHGSAICLLYLDIDRFKEINDTRGHAVGDAVIIEVARRIQSLVRADDMVARLGGDEFAVIVEQASAGTGEAIAGKMLAAMQTPITAGDSQVSVKVSIGIGFALEPDTFEHVLGMADRALYRAKSAGRGTFAIESA